MKVDGVLLRTTQGRADVCSELSPWSRHPPRLIVSSFTMPISTQPSSAGTCPSPLPPCLVDTMVLTPLTSTSLSYSLSTRSLAGLLALLSESDQAELQTYALEQLNVVVDQFWPEISEHVVAV